jgi:transposase
VGIDVSKEKSMVCIMKPYGEIVVSPYEVPHTEGSVAELVRLVQSYSEETKVVMEATGTYYLPLLAAFCHAGIHVSVVNPLSIKKYMSESIRKGKTDKLDAVRIANYGIDRWLRLEQYVPPVAIYEELKILGRQYSHYISIKIASKIALTNLLDRTMPGIKNLIASRNANKPTQDKLCDFVEEFWHYDNITGKSEACFISEFCLWAKRKGYRNSQIIAQKIYAMACNGIPTLPSNVPSTKMLTLEAVRVLKEINKTLEMILSQMQVLASSLPEYGVVREMPGVGEVLAPRLIAEIGDVRRFHSGSALVAYAGLDSPPNQSGSFYGTKRHISKRGSPLLRKTGYEVMKCLKTVKPTEDASVYLFMLKKESEGKPKKVAKIAALNKFLRIYYARVSEVYQT